MKSNFFKFAEVMSQTAEVKASEILRDLRFKCIQQGHGIPEIFYMPGDNAISKLQWLRNYTKEWKIEV